MGKFTLKNIILLCPLTKAKRIVSSIPTQGNKIFNIFILVAVVTMQSAAVSSGTQHAMPPMISAENGEAKIKAKLLFKYKIPPIYEKRNEIINQIENIYFFKSSTAI